MRDKKTIIIVILQLLLLFFVILPVQAAIPSYSSAEVWNKLISQESVLLIDTRSDVAYSNAHIPTAINIPFSQDIDPNYVTTITDYGRSENIFYCSCTAGANAEHYAQELANLGLQDAFFLHDDFRDWPYDIVTGSDPGTVAIDSSNLKNNNKNNKSPPFEISDPMAKKQL